MNQMNALIANNFFYVVMAFGVIFLIMLFVIILMKMDISEMRRQYKKMMSGSEGANLENMLSEAVLVSRAGLDGEKILTDLEAHKSEKLNYLSTILTRRLGVRK